LIQNSPNLLKQMTTIDLTDFEISWECPAAKHQNSLLITLDEHILEGDYNQESYDDLMSIVYDDPDIIRQNPCHQCGSIGFNQVLCKMLVKRQNPQNQESAKRRKI